MNNTFEKMFGEYFSRVGQDHVADDLKEIFKNKVKTIFYQGAVALLFGIRTIQNTSCCNFHSTENVEKFLDEAVDDMKKLIDDGALDELYGPLHGEKQKESKESHLVAMMELLKEMGFTEPTSKENIPMVIDPAKRGTIH